MFRNQNQKFKNWFSSNAIYMKQDEHEEIKNIRKNLYFITQNSSKSLNSFTTHYVCVCVFMCVASESHIKMPNFYLLDK